MAAFAAQGGLAGASYHESGETGVFMLVWTPIGAGAGAGVGAVLPVGQVTVYRAKLNTVQLGKTGTDTNFLLLEIGCLSQRFAALTEQCWG